MNEIDNPELTDAELAQMRPARDVLPQAFMLAYNNRKRGVQKSPTKKAITLRLDNEIIERFKATGKGWQSRMNDALGKASLV